MGKKISYGISIYIYCKLNQYNKWKLLFAMYLRVIYLGKNKTLGIIMHCFYGTKKYCMSGKTVNIVQAHYQYKLAGFK